MTVDEFAAECERVAKSSPLGMSRCVPGQPFVRVLNLPFGIDYREAMLDGGVARTVALRLRAMADQIESNEE